GHDRAVRVALLGEEALQLERLDLGEKHLRLALELVGERLVRFLLDERDQTFGILDLTLQLPVGLVDAPQCLELGHDFLGSLGVAPELRRGHLGLELPGTPFALFDVKDSSGAPPGFGVRLRASFAWSTSPSGHTLPW